MPYFDYVQAHQREYRLYTTLQIFHRDLHWDILLNDVFYPQLARFGIKDKVEAEYVALYYINAITAVIDHWVTRGFTETKDEIYEVIHRCVESKIVDI